MSSSKKPPVGKALKIRLYPNSEEKQKLLKWIGTARCTYNQCLAAINSDINKNIYAQIISLNLKNLKTLILSGFLIPLIILGMLDLLNPTLPQRKKTDCS